MLYKMGHMIVVGLPKLRLLRKNPSVGSAPPRANRTRDKATQRVVSSRHTRASSGFVSESRLEGFLHAPPCGLVSSCLGFPVRDYPGKSLETTYPKFEWGEGTLALVWSYGEALALAGSHP
jgi:hypothetical protein